MVADNRPWMLSRALCAKQLSAAYCRKARRIRQDHIAAEFGISKIPLRETLLRLEGQGLVTVLPRRGVFVTETSSEKLEDIFQIRLALEPQVLEVAIPNMTEGVFSSCEQFIERMAQRDTEELGKLNWQFHRALYAPSGREMSLQILENMSVHVDRYVRLHMGLIDLSRNSNDEHWQILQACRKKEVKTAKRLLSDHIYGVLKSMEKFLARKKRRAGKGN